MSSTEITTTESAIASTSTIAPTIASTLTAAEEEALSALLSGPLVTVQLRIAVKFRAAGHDFGNAVLVNHQWQWPIPAVFAKANPNPVSFNTHGIDVQLQLSQQTVIG